MRQNNSINKKKFIAQFITNFEHKNFLNLHKKIFSRTRTRVPRAHNAGA
jgi:hypothetical protein